MPETLDIQRVINTSTVSVSLDDLGRKGFKQVKVLNHAVITRLIGEAVDAVLAARCTEISKEEREKVIKEARTQFEALAKKRLEKEHSRIEQLEAANSSLVAEADTLKKRLTAAGDVQGERDQLSMRCGAAEAEGNRLRAQNQELEDLAGKQKTEIASLKAEQSSRQGEVDRLTGLLEGASAEGKKWASELESVRSKLGGLESSLRRSEDDNRKLKDSLAEVEKRAAQLEGELTAKKEELERSTGQPQAAMEKILLAVNERLERITGPGDVGKIMLSLDSLSRKLSNLPASGGSIGDGGHVREFKLDLLSGTGEGSIESNIKNVKVKQAKAGGVTGALAKLKKLQKGGEDGE